MYTEQLSRQIYLKAKPQHYGLHCTNDKKGNDCLHICICFGFALRFRLSSRPRHSWTRHNGQGNTLGTVRQSLARTLRVKGVSEPLTSADLILAQAIGRKTVAYFV